MDWLLMHKNKRVMSFIISDKTGKISKIVKNRQNLEHVPVGARLNDDRLREWWSDRAIPYSRVGASNALKALGYTSTIQMMVTNLALTLTDCYWIKPADSDLTWEEVNLFGNKFEDAFGKLTVNTAKKSEYNNKDLRQPSSKGELQKQWCIADDDRRYLLKGNWGLTSQQSINEIFACLVHKKQGFKHYTEYSLLDIDDKQVGCYSYNYCNENVEFVPAYELMCTRKLKHNTSWYNLFKEVCMDIAGFDEEYIEDFLEYEILTDYVITNTDRHMNNIGVLRNPDTLEYYGFAPIYDSGNSMFFNHRGKFINVYKIQTNSFLKHEIDLLRLVKNRNAIDLDRLPSEYEFMEIYLRDTKESKDRLDSLYRAYQQKIMILKRFQAGEDVWKRYR